MDARIGNRLKASRGARLSLIADTVGCSVENLLNGPVSEELDDTAEMLRLWSGIKTEEARRATLNLMRAIVEAQDGGSLR